MTSNLKLLIALILWGGTSAEAQINNHLIGSTFGGLNSIHLNPAISGSGKKFEASLYGLSLNGDFFSTPHYTRGIDGNLSRRHDFEVYFPGFMFCFGEDRQFGLGFVGKQTGLSRMYTSSEETLGVIHGKSNSTISNPNTDAYELTHVYSDLGLTFGWTQKHNKKRRIRSGFTIKLITGNYIRTASAVDIHTGFNPQLLSNSARRFQYGDSELYAENEPKLIQPSWFESNPNDPTSIGVDVGFVYDFLKPDDSLTYFMDNQQNYLQNINPAYLSFGVSATNLGAGLNYTKPIKSIVDNSLFRDTALVAATSATFHAQVPSLITLFAEWRPAKHLSFNLNFRSLSFNGIDDRKFSENTVGLIPKFEKGWFGFYLPMQLGLENDRVNPEFGVAARLGFIHIRLDNVEPYLNGRNRKSGISAYVSVPIHYRNKRDSDGDGVSNEYDLCNDYFGTWWTKGCEDEDGDSVRDQDDDCIGVPGLRSLNGCPDSDGDGIRDRMDSCKYDPGLVEFSGCPDTDGDGIPDKRDNCPKIPAGIDGRNGCPDSDGDGIYDDTDLCPNKPGDIELVKFYKGCPKEDDDLDGIWNHQDSCIDTKGVLENNGCPLEEDRSIVNTELALLTENFQWGFNSWDLSDEQMNILENVFELMAKNDDLVLNVFVIVDPDVDEDIGKELSNRRLLKLKSYFKQSGVSEEAFVMKVRGFEADDVNLTVFKFVII